MDKVDPRKKHVETHPLVTLLLARIESHPEEFTGGWARWHEAIAAVGENASDREGNLLAAAIKKARLNKAHQDAMDELLNGDERRREAEEGQKKYSATLAGAVTGTSSPYPNMQRGALSQAQYDAQMQHMQQQMQLQQHQIYNHQQSLSDMLNDKAWKESMQERKGPSGWDKLKDFLRWEGCSGL